MQFEKLEKLERLFFMMHLLEDIEEQTGRIRLLSQKLEENEAQKVRWIFGAGLA